MIVIIFLLTLYVLHPVRYTSFSEELNTYTLTAYGIPRSEIVPCPDEIVEIEFWGVGNVTYRGNLAAVELALSQIQAIPGVDYSTIEKMS